MRRPAGQHHIAGASLGAARDDMLPGAKCAVGGEAKGFAFDSDVLEHDDRIGAYGQWGPGHDFNSLTGSERRPGPGFARAH